MRGLAAIAAVTCTALAFLAAGAQAALPGRDYDFSYFKDSTQSVLVNLDGRRSVPDGVGFSIAVGCVPKATSTLGKAIAISASGTFKTTRALQSIESGRTVGKVALRGKFTSASRLVLRARFTRGTCKSREYRFVLRGTAPQSD